MVGNDLFRTDFRGHIERDFILEPRRLDHTRLFVLDIADGAWHDIADTVDHPDLEGRVSADVHLNRVLRDEFRLRGHNGPARGGLRQLVDSAVTPAVVCDIRNDKRIHKPLDKRRFSGTDGAYHSYIDVAVCSAGNVLINISLFHSDFLLFICWV